jgi:uncharacterized membrane protein
MTKMPGPTDARWLKVVIVIIAAAAVSGVVSQEYNEAKDNGTYPGNLILNIYIDESGKALVNGYADSIDGLPFLKDSQHNYDINTKQLYALTNLLTYKSGDDWEMKLSSSGNYSEFHSIFYLPASVKVSKINSTPRLDYLVSASNDSFQVDLHGYDVSRPMVTIDYQLPLKEEGLVYASNAMQMLPIAAIFGLALVSLYVVMWVRRRNRIDPPEIIQNMAIETEDSPVEPEFDDENQREDELKETNIKITSEMAAVMETLTAREKAVMTALIEHKGRMNQADIRYETNIPKSSLTGILLSLERRKLITKREKGRTNVIELTSRFLSKKEDSGLDPLAEYE